MNDTPISRFDEKPPLWVFDEKPFRWKAVSMKSRFDEKPLRWKGTPPYNTISMQKKFYEIWRWGVGVGVGFITADAAACTAALPACDAKISRDLYYKTLYGRN